MADAARTLTASPRQLKALLAEIAEVQPDLYWRSQLAILRPDAATVNVDHAIAAMRLWADAVKTGDRVSVAFAGHALDDAVARLNVVAVAS